MQPCQKIPMACLLEIVYLCVEAMKGLEASLVEDPEWISCYIPLLDKISLTLQRLQSFVPTRLPSKPLLENILCFPMVFLFIHDLR